MSNSLKIIHFQRLLNLPELNIGIFSFLLNFFWEIQQMQFFQISSEFFCLDMIQNCTLATVGDVGISLTAFWVVAVLSKSRQWFRNSHWWQLSSFILVGVAITAIFEALATGVLNLWEYADIMPVIPFFGTGLLPLLQWLLIPTIIIWFVKRQLSDFRRTTSS
jgi:ABC-type Fe3+-siderophore transport system permease subunit